MRTFFLSLIIATVAITARAQEVSAVMQNGPLDLTAPLVIDQNDGREFNMRLAGFLYIFDGTLSWAGGPSEAAAWETTRSTLGFVTPSAAGEFVFAGNVRVGLWNGFGTGTLNVRDEITSGGAPVPRWLGTSASAPSGAREGDQYYDSGTSKVRILTDAGWINLN